MDAHPDARLPDAQSSARLGYAGAVTTLTLTPSQAADMLGVSSTALRRAAPIYEQHFGPLPRERRGGRLWTAEALEQMRLAFDAVHRKQVVSISTALEMLNSGADLLPVQASGVGGRVDASTAELLAEVLTEIRAARMENAELKAMAEAQGRELAALRSAMTEGRALAAPVLAGGEQAREVVTAHPERVAERVKPDRPAGFVGLLLKVIGVRL